MAIHIHGGLRGLRIARLLARHPELANDHDFTVLGSVSWMYLLTFQPRFADKCDKWDEIQRHSPYFVAKVRDGKSVVDKLLKERYKMGVDVSVKMKCVVSRCEDGDDGTERLYSFLSALAAGKILLEPLRVRRDVRLDQLVCVLDSRLRTKTGVNRFLNRRKFPSTHLPSLCKRFAIKVEVWTQCGEVGYDEHFIVDYSGKITTTECMDTIPWDMIAYTKPSPEQEAWSLRWGKWTIPTAEEYEERAAERRRARKEQRDDMPF